MDKLRFVRHRRYGQTFYTCKAAPNLRVVLASGGFRIQVKSHDDWVDPKWHPTRLSDISSAESWLRTHDWITASEDKIDKKPSNIEADFADAMDMLSFNKGDSDKYRKFIATNPQKYIECWYEDGLVKSIVYEDGQKLKHSGIPESTSDVARLIRTIERVLKKYGQEVVAETLLTSGSSRNQVILCAISTRDLSKNLVRVKSSNVWAYAMNVKNPGDAKGDMLAQFKGKDGGPGDIYIYYDVPVIIYRRWVTAPSKGHYFWQYIRDVYKYSKLTGDKRGVLRNAIN